MSSISKVERLQTLQKEKGVLRRSDLIENGIPLSYLSRMVARNLLIRSGRGLYTPAMADITEHHSLVEVSRQVPASVICLLSALSFHQLTTELPSSVWIALPTGHRRPHDSAVSLHVSFLRPDLLDVDVEEHFIEGVPVKIFSAARTVADCFRHRHQVGMEIALAALRDYRHQGQGTVDQLWACAGRRQVQRVMRPYLEAIL